MTQFTQLFICCLLIIANFSAATQPDKPIMVVQLFRHGARAPSNLKYDPSWKYPGELTPTGMRQHYILGSVIGERYSHLLTDYSPADILIRSTNMNRTMMSASSHLFGAFQKKGPSLPAEINKDLTLPPFSDKVLVDQIANELFNSSESIPSGFQPLVVQVEKNVGDTILFVGPWNCAQMNIWQAKRVVDSYNEEIVAHLQDTMTSLNSLGYKIQNLHDLQNFGDTLINNYFDNRKMPKGIEYGSAIYNDAVFAFKWYSSYNYIGVGLERVLKALVLLDQIVEWFDGVAQGTKALKFAFLSAHDTTLLPLLGLYNITHPDCLFENYKSEKLGLEHPYPDCVYPMFASQIIYELYNKAEGPYVRFLYNGKPFKICSKGEGYECSLKDFLSESRQLLMNHSSKDYQSLCSVEAIIPNNDNDKDTGNNGASFWVVAIMVVMALAIGVLTYLLITERRQRMGDSKGFYENMDVKRNFELKELIISNNSTSKGL